MSRSSLCTEIQCPPHVRMVMSSSHLAVRHIICQPSVFEGWWEGTPETLRTTEQGSHRARGHHVTIRYVEGQNRATRPALCPAASSAHIQTARRCRLRVQDGQYVGVTQPYSGGEFRVAVCMDLLNASPLLQDGSPDVICCA